MMIVTLTEEAVDGVVKPVVEGAFIVKPEADGWYSAHFKGGWFQLLRLDAGEYAVFTHDPNGVLPSLEGQDWSDYKSSHANLRKWPAWKCEGEMPNPDGPGTVPVSGLRVRLPQVPPQAASQGVPWRIGGLTITSAVPTLPSVIGSVSLDEVETP